MKRQKLNGLLREFYSNGLNLESVSEKNTKKESGVN